MSELTPDFVRVLAELGAFSNLLLKDLLEFVKLHCYSSVDADAI